MVRSIMNYTDLPIPLWGFALETALYLLNCAPSKLVSSTLYEIWYGKQPSFKHVKILGCLAYIKKLNTDKLEIKYEKGRFV